MSEMSEQHQSDLKRKFDSKRLSHLVDLHRTTKQHNYQRPSSFIQNDSSFSLTKQAAALTFQQFEEENDNDDESHMYSEVRMTLPLTQKMRELQKNFQDASDPHIQSKYVSALNRLNSSSSIASETTSDSLVALAYLAKRHFTSISIHTDSRGKSTLSQSNNSVTFLDNNGSSNNNLQEKKISESIHKPIKDRIKSRWSLFFWNNDNISQSHALLQNSATEDVSEISANDTSDSSSIPSTYGELSGSILSQEMANIKTQQIASAGISMSHTEEQPPLSLLSSSNSVSKHLYLLSYLSRLGNSSNDDNKNEFTNKNIITKAYTSEAQSSTNKVSIKQNDDSKKTNILGMKHLFFLVIFGFSFIVILKQNDWKFQKWYNQNINLVHLEEIFTSYLIQLEETIARWKLFLVSSGWYEKGLNYRNELWNILIPIQEWLFLSIYPFIVLFNDFKQRTLIPMSQNYFTDLINLWEKIDIFRKYEDVIFDEEYFHPFDSTTMVVSIISQNNHLDDFWDMIGKLCVNHNYTPRNNDSPMIDMYSQISSNQNFWQSRITFVKTSEIISLTGEQNGLHTKDHTPHSLVEFDDQQKSKHASSSNQSIGTSTSLVINENNFKSKFFLLEQSDDSDLMNEKPLAEIVGDFFRRVRDGRKTRRQHRKNKRKAEEKRHKKGHKIFRFSLPWKKTK